MAKLDGALIVIVGTVLSTANVALSPVPTPLPASRWLFLAQSKCPASRLR